MVIAGCIYLCVDSVDRGAWTGVGAWTGCGQAGDEAMGRGQAWTGCGQAWTGVRGQACVDSVWTGVDRVAWTGVDSHVIKGSRTGVDRRGQAWIGVDTWCMIPACNRGPDASLTYRDLPYRGR